MLRLPIMDNHGFTNKTQSMLLLAVLWNYEEVLMWIMLQEWFEKFLGTFPFTV